MNDYEFSWINRGIFHFNNNDFKEAKNCFQKSGMDILSILTCLPLDIIEQIALSNLFFQLIEEDNIHDSIFLNSILKEDIKNKPKYMKIYIISLLIVSLLHVKCRHENTVAHYTQRTTLGKMLFDKSSFRLNTINYSNDLTEGRILIDLLFPEKENKPKKRVIGENRVFAGSFTFNHNSLNQFRLYGKDDNKEASGVSIVFKESFFYKYINKLYL